MSAAVTPAQVPGGTPVTTPVRTNRITAPVALPDAPPVETAFTPRPVQNVFEAQLALARQGISSGSIDGAIGSQTRAALRAFQLREGLPQTGTLDGDTRNRLALSTPGLTSFRIESADLARPLPIATTWLGKSEQPRLDFETLLELVAERSHAHPELIRKLNGTINWSAVLPGTEIKVPSVERERPAVPAAFLQIRLADRTLEAFDANNK